MYEYRIGFPGWKIAARLGLPLKVTVFVIYDDESNMLVAESNDFLPYFGVVTEGETFAKLTEKVGECCEMAMEEVFGTTRITPSIRQEMILVEALP